jgi:hypothetical protein
MDNATRNQGKRRTVRMLVERASRAEPRLIVIEDFHWADDLIIACLAELAVAAATCPMLLVLTSRVEGDDTDTLPSTAIVSRQPLWF